MIQQIVGESNRYVNEASPIVDARLKDGSRVNVVLNPVAVNGPNPYNPKVSIGSNYDGTADPYRQRN